MGTELFFCKDRLGRYPARYVWGATMYDAGFIYRDWCESHDSEEYISPCDIVVQNIDAEFEFIETQHSDEILNPEDKGEPKVKIYDVEYEIGFRRPIRVWGTSEVDVTDKVINALENDEVKHFPEDIAPGSIDVRVHGWDYDISDGNYPVLNPCGAPRISGQRVAVSKVGTRKSQRDEYVRLLTYYLDEFDSEGSKRTKRDIENVVEGVTTAFYCLEIISEQEMQDLAVPVENHFRGITRVTKDDICKILGIHKEDANGCNDS